MCVQELSYCIVILLLKMTYFHVSANTNYLISERFMLEDIPVLPMIFAKSEYLPNGSCKEDTQRFLHGLFNSSVWAIQMLDSSTKYPDGIAYGHTRHLGNFDECYNLQVNIMEENVNIHEINGRYCLVDVEYKNKYETSIHRKTPISKHQDNFVDMNKSFWEMIEDLEDLVHVRRNRLQLALCVPATCNAKDIEMALKTPLKELGVNKNIELSATVQSVSCQTAKEAPKYTLGAAIYCSILLFLLSVVIISTWYDYTSKKNANYTSIMRNIMKHFSARRNYKKLLCVHYTNTGLDAVHLIRLITSITALYIHNILQYLYNPTINAVDLEKMYENCLITMIVNATFIINIFFAMSGVLLASKLLKDLDQYKKLNFVKNVASRYLRLTPLYAVMIGFYIWIFPMLGSGPFWHIVVTECTHCVKTWWMNLLYINNYVAPSQLCVFHGWYLAVEFQLFVCSQFVIYAFWCMPRKIGYLFLGVLTFISCMVSFVATYTYGASPTLRFTPYMTEATELPEFETYYIKGHMCATGYLVGLIAGAILHDHKKSMWRLSKFWSHLLIYPIPVILCISTQYWAHKIIISKQTNLLEEAFFAFFQRLVPSLCVCSTIVLLSVGSRLESYYKFFTPRWIQPLSNLCYGVYIINMTLVLNNIGQTRTARTFGVLNTVWDTIPLLIVSFLFSLLFAIYIEIPFRNLAKWLIPEKNKIIKLEITHDSYDCNERKLENIHNLTKEE